MGLAAFAPLPSDRLQRRLKQESAQKEKRPGASRPFCSHNREFRHLAGGDNS
jgi:hypothetical protein